MAMALAMAMTLVLFGSARCDPNACDEAPPGAFRGKLSSVRSPSRRLRVLTRLSPDLSLRNGDSERRGAPQPRNDRDSLQRHLRPDSLRLGLGRHVPHHNLSPLRAHRVASRHLGTRCLSGPFGLRVVVRQRVRPSPPPHQEDQKPQVVLVFTGRPPEHQVSSLSLVFSLHIGFGSSDDKNI